MPSSINSDYKSGGNNWPAIIGQLTNIAKAGFTHIQWIQDWEGEYMYSPSEMYFVRDLLKDLGLNCHSLHASEGGGRTVIRPDGSKFFQNRRRISENVRKDYTSPEEFIRLAGVDLIKNRMEFCAHTGAKVIVLHMQLPYIMFEENEEDKKEYYRLVFKSLDELESYSRNAGLRIAVENLPTTPEKYTTECFDRLFERYDTGFVGLCFDSGHATLTGGDYCYFLEKYQSRLLALHLQDTGGPPAVFRSDDPEMRDLEILQHDRHWVPFSGVNDWDRIARLIAGSPVELPADFEVAIKTPMEEEEEFRFLVDCREKAEKFHQMVLSYRS